MTHVLVLGGGVVGASTAIRLARAGHAVTVLDRDAGPLPADAEEANTAWRRAIGQFDRPHSLLPRGHRWFAEHVPEVLDELHALGATPFDYLRDLAPPTVVAGLEDREDDTRFRTLSTRRPTLELAVQRVLDREPGVAVHRDTRVTGLTTQGADPVRVTGVVTAAGTTFTADVVLDAMGRRSPVERLLRDAGATPLPVEEVDARFSYHGRYYASPDGTLPPIPGLLVPAGTLSLLTIPSDNGTWSVTIYTTGDDEELAGLVDENVFEAVVRAHPSHAHLVDGEPITPVERMVSDAGKRRTLVTEDGPVVLGLLPLGDAWASTNPSYGRGMTLGLLQTEVVARVLADHDGDHEALARAWQTAIDTDVAPWWDDTVQLDQSRVRQIERQRARAAGAEVPSREPSPTAQFVAAFQRAAGRDEDVLRGLLDISVCNALPPVVLARPGLAARVMELGAADDTAPRGRSGPTREELVALAGG